jgi:hypothetical protein
MKSDNTVFWVMVTRPLFVMIFTLMAVRIAHLFRYWMPEGRIKRFFLVSIPEARCRRRLRAEARKRERQFAAYDRGAHLGRQFKRLLRDPR